MKFYVQKVVLDTYTVPSESTVSYQGTAALINQPEFNDELDDGTGTEFTFSMNYLNSEIGDFTDDHHFFNI